VTPLQVLELVIFAALAAVVLFQLYAVLGRRVGRQPEDAAEPEAERLHAPDEPESPRAEDVLEDAPLTGVAAVRARDPSFDVRQFLQGARAAYEMVVRGFAEGDRETLQNLTSPSVYQTFDKAIHQRDTEGRSEKVEFLQPPRADLESAEMIGNLAQVKVRFLAEVRARSKGPEGEAVDDRRTAEVWTFERAVDSPDPNWALARVEAAEI
jgi:predicted lipid-binding transport protein (Tim44 family)